MFGAIARRYDLANHTLSCGIDFYWRKRAANTVASWRPGKIVDLATGTGDLALALQKKLPDAEVTGVDFLHEMLELAQEIWPLRSRRNCRMRKSQAWISCLKCWSWRGGKACAKQSSQMP